MLARRPAQDTNSKPTKQGPSENISALFTPEACMALDTGLVTHICSSHESSLMVTSKTNALPVRRIPTRADTGGDNAWKVSTCRSLQVQVDERLAFGAANSTHLAGVSAA